MSVETAPSSPAAPLALATSSAGRGPLRTRAPEELDLHALATSALQHTGAYQRALLLAFLVGGTAVPFGASPLGWAAILVAVAIGLVAHRAYLGRFADDASALGIERHRARRLFELALSTRRRIGQRRPNPGAIEDGVERALVAAIRR